MKYTAAQQEYIDGQVTMLDTSGLDGVEKTILKTCKLPIGTYPNGKWYTLPVIYSISNGFASYITRDGKILTEEQLLNWVKDLPASITFCPFYVNFFVKQQKEVTRKLNKRRDIIMSRMATPTF